MAKYLFRIDDVCQEMDWKKFIKLISTFDKYNVKPILAVVPDCQDPILKKNPPKENFWGVIRNLEKNGHTIGMHGWQHKYINENGGILKIHQGSEFAELPYKIQLKKIKKGKEVLEKNGVKTEIFMAPGHSFDKNTLMALKESGFKYISDSIALWPFKKYGIIWIPQIAWRPKKILGGIITFCLHSNNFSEKDFQEIDNFIKNNQKNIIDFNSVLKWCKNQNKAKNFVLFLPNLIFRLLWYIRFNIKFNITITKLHRRFKILSSIPLKDFFNISKIKIIFISKPYTKLGYLKLSALYDMSACLEKEKLAGNFVECGVWNGGSAAIMSYVVRNNNERNIWLFDSWEGHPQPSKYDLRFKDNFLAYKGMDLGYKEKVEHLLFKKIKLNSTKIHLVKGWFSKTLPAYKKDLDKISLLHLDCDLYESIKFCLEELWDKVIDGGFVIIDDYEWWKGCKKAVDEFIKQNNLKIKLIKVETSVHFRKM